MSTKQLNRRQVRWAKFLSKFNFKIIYRSEKQDIKLDNLTRRIQNLSQIKNDIRRQFQQKIIHKKVNLKSDMNEVLKLTFAMLNNVFYSTTQLISMIYDMFKKKTFCSWQTTQ